MNASYQWLRDFVQFDLDPNALADLLTRRCATVDAVTPMRTDLSEIVVARVVEAAPHPNSDHLWVTKVDAGGGEILDVVCGAPNVKAGKLYPFAATGATLPGGLKIEKRKIRGELSNGMLCSARELGLGADHEGILELVIEAEPGTKFLDAMPVGDTRIEIDVLPNRPDLLSHRGLAREIAAALDHRYCNPPIVGAAKGNPVTVAVGAGRREGKTGGIHVKIDDVDGCPRYAGAVVRGVAIGPSPDWLAQRLLAAGVRSINNVVDVTNYMLLGFGQPMHAFDASRLEGKAITVRRAAPNEPIRTLDGVDRKLSNETVVIADDARVQAIAGVMGGSDSEVIPDTRDLFLEVAAFNPKRTRASRKRIGIVTDASYRFERGVDVEAIPDLLAYALKMIIAVAGGSVDGKPVDLYPAPIRREPVKLRMARVAQVLGETFSLAEVRDNLKILGFEVKSGLGASALSVQSPPWRTDVIDEIDLIEELARTRGYDSFGAELRAFRRGNVPDASAFLLEKRVREVLVSLGLLEVRPMPFVAEGKGASVRVANPLAEDEPFLRSSIIDTLISRAEYNLARLQRNIRLFEIGTVFRAPEGGKAPVLPVENLHAGVLVQGHRAPLHFSGSADANYDEWDAKWIAEVATRTAFGNTDIKLILDDDSLWSIEADGNVVGTVQRLSMNAPVWAAPAFGIEIDLSAATEAKATAPTYRALSNTPPVEVDLALLVPAKVSAAQIEEVVRSEAGELLESVVLFDEFRGKELGEGNRSLAWRLTFRSPDRTLKEKEVQARTAKIVRSLEEKLGARQRTS